MNEFTYRIDWDSTTWCRKTKQIIPIHRHRVFKSRFSDIKKALEWVLNVSNTRHENGFAIHEFMLEDKEIPNTFWLCKGKIDEKYEVVKPYSIMLVKDNEVII